MAYHHIPPCQSGIRSLVQCKVTAPHPIVCLRVLAEVLAGKPWLLLVTEARRMAWTEQRNEVVHSSLPKCTLAFSQRLVSASRAGCRSTFLQQAGEPAKVHHNCRRLKVGKPWRHFRVNCCKNPGSSFGNSRNFGERQVARVFRSDTNARPRELLSM